MRVILFCYGVIFVAAGIWGLLGYTPYLGPLPMAILSLVIGGVSVIWPLFRGTYCCKRFLLTIGIALACLTLIEFFKVETNFLGSGATTWLHFLMTVPAIIAGTTR